MHWAGLEPHVTTLQILLPVGISFYTFQSIAYVIDVYRGHLKAEKNLLHYATFVGFFPQLVAGPIERATHLLPQIKAPNVIAWNNIYSGFNLIGFGLFKKIVLADNLAPIANAVFTPNQVTPMWWESILGIYAFALQIYCDFSAYSDIARGVSRMMGFELMRNFDLPYFAVNPSDFWRRWHISLSTWLRDYLYIPLGGNRGGAIATYRNLFLTMLLGGLWHGATWLFVIWGAYHGLLLCLHRAFKPMLDRYCTFEEAGPRKAWTIIRIVVFFQFTCIGWLFFRATDLPTLQYVIRPFYDPVVGQARTVLSSPMLFSLATIAVLLLAAQAMKYLTNDHRVIFRIPVPLRALVYVGLILGMILFGEFSGGDFIYFQF
jgi:D-alanyl-lipoteichoic acid acyltransferase DltB (MBOAT superfamily)